MAKRNANGYGGISKLSGKRSKPYMAYISEMTSEGVILPPDVQKSLKTEITALDTASTMQEITQVYANVLCTLYQDMTVEEFKKMIVPEVKARIKKRTFKSKQIKKPIGYFKTSKEANVALAEYNKNPYDLDKRKTTFKEIYELAYKDARIESKSKSSIAAYSSGYKKCESLHDMAFTEIKLAHLQAVVDANASMSKATITNILSVFRMVYTYGMQHDLIDKDYSGFVKINEHAEQEDKTPYTREEIKKLWDNLHWKFEGERKSLLQGEYAVDIILILIYTGMRIDELLSTKAEDVHLAERYITVRGTKTDNAFRIVPIHKKIEPLIKNRLEYSGEYFISTQAGEQITYHNFRLPLYKKLCEDLELKHTIHETRHTFATFTTKLNSTLRSYMIGHSTKNITNDVYTHPEVLLPELIAEIDKLDL